jgi:hypothetical protein
LSDFKGFFFEKDVLKREQRLRFQQNSERETTIEDSGPKIVLPKGNSLVIQGP